MTSPDLCVVIPAYNAEATLGEQLSALAAQQVDFPWEVVVCDNGSTDDTPGMVRHWQARLPLLRLVDASARRGPAAARNIGVGHTTAPLIAFCDADDVVGEGWLPAMHTALQHDTFVAGNSDDEALSGSRGSQSWTVSGTYTKPFLPELPAAATNNMGIHRAVFDEVGGFEESLRTNEDTDLCWRVQLAGYPLVHHPEIVLHVRKRDGLFALFRQGYSYGTGDKQLRHRYAHVIAERAPNASASTNDQGNPAEALGSVRGALRRAASKLRTVRRPADLSNQAWQLGFVLGARVGPLDRSAPQVRTRPDGRSPS